MDSWSVPMQLLLTSYQSVPFLEVMALPIDSNTTDHPGSHFIRNITASNFTISNSK